MALAGEEVVLDNCAGSDFIVREGEVEAGTARGILDALPVGVVEIALLYRVIKKIPPDVAYSRGYKRVW